MTDATTFAAFDRAFAQVSAYALLLDGQAVGRVAIKRGGSVTMLVQVWLTSMQTGRAGGGGYDRTSAAFDAAARKLAADKSVMHDLRPERTGVDTDLARRTVAAIIEAGKGAEGRDWKDRLEDAGLTVANVIDS